jgi:hypothetical protein
MNHIGSPLHPVRVVCLCRICAAGGSWDEYHRTGITAMAPLGSAQDDETPTLQRLLPLYDPGIRVALFCPGCGAVHEHEMLQRSFVRVGYMPPRSVIVTMPPQTAMRP